MTSVSAASAILQLKTRVVALALLAILGAATLVSLPVVDRQMGDLPSQLASKHSTLLQQMGMEIAQAIDLGIPLHQLRGLDDLLAATQTHHPEIGYLAFVAADGAVLASVGRSEMDSGILTEVTPSAPGIRPVLTDLGAYHALRIPVFDVRGEVHGDVLGDLHLGIDRSYIARLLRDRLFDILTVMLVTGILATELLLLWFDSRMTAPVLALREWADSVRAGKAPPGRFSGRGELAGLARQLLALDQAVRRSASTAVARMHWLIMLRHVRVALFLFVLADALTLAFLPLFARTVVQPDWGLPDALMSSLPVVVYWLFSALVQLPGARLLDRYSHRGVFLLGGLAAVVGALGSAWAPDYGYLLAARALAGVGLGLVFMVCQAAILTHVPAERRTLGVATFTGVFFLATFSGMALGGIIADQVGYRWTFLVAAGLVSLACLFAYLTFGPSREPTRERVGKLTRESAGQPTRELADTADTARDSVSLTLASGSGGSRPSSVGWQAYGQLLLNRYFMGLLLLVALPNRMFNVALVFLLAPLFLDDLGASASEIGRIVGVYGLVMAFAAPLLARWVDRQRGQVWAVVGGTLICSLGALLVLPWPTIWGILMAVTLMGLGQALVIPAQMTLVPSVAARNADRMGLPRVYAVFRAGERVPAFLGPLFGAALVAVLGYAWAVAIFGVWLAVSAVFLLLLFRSHFDPQGGVYAR